ncbi:hypothetical protein H206_03608 [Candidatus Electrothrix aarhusensis]|uniref:Uncharacterized protein n=1 Tax=Candidatus Electrothrix aarhusensis TaxID=1859131 RepID=A0A444IST9_9BACT|nr:hypothetical protein H206_03608 [Candidatus Electrothrix aarhusensis]
MTEIEFRLPKDDPTLEAAVAEFIQAEFQQTARFTPEPPPAGEHKGLAELAWQLVVIAATIEGSLQFAERAKRMERVKKLLAIIQVSGKPVYLKIRGKAVDLTRLSVDKVMDLLAEDKDDQGKLDN